MKSVTPHPNPVATHSLLMFPVFHLFCQGCMNSSSAAGQGEGVHSPVVPEAGAHDKVRQTTVAVVLSSAVSTLMSQRRCPPPPPRHPPPSHVVVPSCMDFVQASTSPSRTHNPSTPLLQVKFSVCVLISPSFPQPCAPSLCRVTVDSASPPAPFLITCQSSPATAALFS